MPIPIQCPQCQQSYKVDDRLAGKKVKCKNCGASIAVAGVQDEGGEGLYSAPQIPTTEKCPQCHAAVTPGSRLCLSCGLDLVTGQPTRTQVETAIPGAAVVDAIVQAGADAPKKRKAWTRPSGNPTLESIDELLKIGILALLLAGIIVAMVHIYKTPVGLSFPAALPMVVTLALLLGLLAPLGVFAITTLIKQFKILPREDNYTRLAICLVLPFAVGLMAGWPGGSLEWLVTLSWILAAALLIYLFRGELIEWVASVFMAGVAFAVGALVISLLAGPLNLITGPMYSDMLPGAPWTTIATGHSPAPELPRVASPAVAQTSPDTQPAPAGTMMAAASAAPASQNAPGKQVASTQTSPDIVTPPGTQAAINTRPALPSPLVQSRPAPIPLASIKPIASPYFANIVTDEPGLHGVADIVVAEPPIFPAAASPYFLAIKNDDTSSTAERWSVSPVQKNGALTFPQNARFPNAYALSSKGDLLATLVVFPRMQLEVSGFDAAGRAGKRVMSITPPQPKALPTLLGLLDTTRVLLRWDLEPDTGLSIWNIAAGQLVRNIQLPPVDTSPNAVAVSPNGHTLAILGAHSKNPQDKEPALYLINLENGTRHTLDPTPFPYKAVRLAFSPDSSQIALYAVIAGVPTIMSFKSTGTEASATSTALLTNPPPLPAESQPAAVNHALLWLDNNTWLVGGNDLIDIPSHKRFATLGIIDGTGLLDAQLAGPSSLVLVQPSATDRAISVARIDDARIMAERPK